MKLWVIATEQLPVELLGAEEVTPQAADEYLSRLRRLVREDAAKFNGRVVEDETGQVYESYTVKGHGDAPARSLFVADRRATQLLASLFDQAGKLRRIKIEKGLGAPPGNN